MPVPVPVTCREGAESQSVSKPVLSDAWVICTNPPLWVLGGIKWDFQPCFQIWFANSSSSCTELHKPSPFSDRFGAGARNPLLSYWGSGLPWDVLPRFGRRGERGSWACRSWEDLLAFSWDSSRTSGGHSVYGRTHSHCTDNVQCGLFSTEGLR